MNFVKVLQHSVLASLAIFGTMIVAEQANCEIKPTDADKVDVLVYLNGGTSSGEDWYRRYYSWIDFPYAKYAPVTVKVGAQITCDSNNKCNCPNNESNQVDCAVTFQNICAQQILGEAEFIKLLSCSGIEVYPVTYKEKGFQGCVNDRPGLADKIASCMEGQGDNGPQAIALKNAKELADTLAAAGIDFAKLKEPFFFYNKVFDICISNDSSIWFIHKICLMLKKDIAMSIQQCKKAMGW